MPRTTRVTANISASTTPKPIINHPTEEAFAVAIATITESMTMHLDKAWEARDLKAVSAWEAANNSWITTMQSMTKAVAQQATTTGGQG